jgi:hypothetical protein
MQFSPLKEFSWQYGFVFKCIALWRYVFLQSGDFLQSETWKGVRSFFIWQPTPPGKPRKKEDHP